MAKLLSQRSSPQTDYKTARHISEQHSVLAFQGNIPRNPESVKHYCLPLSFRLEDP
jgi:hypothetical protein